MSLPDVTKAQVLAIAKLVIALAVAFGAPLTGAQQAELISAAGGLAAALVLADALIRHGRSRALVQYFDLLGAAKAGSAAPARQVAAIQRSGAEAAAVQAENESHPPSVPSA